MLLRFISYILIFHLILSSKFSADFIEDLVQYNIIYNLHSDKLTDGLDRIIKDQPERVVSMKTPNQLSYQCVLPVTESKVCNMHLITYNNNIYFV